LLYPEIVEEAIKAIAVFFLILRITSSIEQKVFLAIFFGLLLGFSESFFYLSNILASNQETIFIQRLFLTVPMHILTLLIMTFLGAVNKKLVLVGLVVSIAIHWLFNFFI
jgi:hypothetical protein